MILRDQKLGSEISQQESPLGTPFYLQCPLITTHVQIQLDHLELPGSQTVSYHRHQPKPSTCPASGKYWPRTPRLEPCDVT
ncbi:Uncharacterized protein HZ326_15272 [Fusarium oxysporum f. sp. albedinis]|nr:Uncharacterized protein HZ326_15272 [Fusarium oxysporum f. sp. albedinis]